MSVLSRTNARRLDQRIVIQSKVQTQNSTTGEIVVTWIAFATLWACVDATKASERFAAQQELTGNEYTIWVRWRGDITSNMRIVWNGANLDITGIPNNQKRGRYMTIFATAGINAG